MKRSQFVTVPLAIGAILVTIASFAQPPPECRGFRSATYQSSYDARASFLRKLFESQYDCPSYQKFASAARYLLLRSTFSDRCQSAGVEDATRDTLDDLAKQCLSVSGSEGSDPGSVASASSARAPAEAAALVSCETMGDEAGESAAILYCNPLLVTAPPNVQPGCGVIFQNACERAFYRVVQAAPGCRTRARRDATFQDTLQAACTPP